MQLEQQALSWPLSFTLEVCLLSYVQLRCPTRGASLGACSFPHSAGLVKENHVYHFFFFSNLEKFHSSATIPTRPVPRAFSMQFPCKPCSKPCKPFRHRASRGYIQKLQSNL